MLADETKQLIEYSLWLPKASRSTGPDEADLLWLNDMNHWRHDYEYSLPSRLSR